MGITCTTCTERILNLNLNLNLNLIDMDMVDMNMVDMNMVDMNMVDMNKVDMDVADMVDMDMVGYDTVRIPRTQTTTMERILEAISTATGSIVISGKMDTHSFKAWVALEKTLFRSNNSCFR